MRGSVGENTAALGGGAVAEGVATIALAQESHAEGFASITRGDNSHAQGHGSVAAGGRAHASGFNTVAWRQGEAAESCGAFPDHSPIQNSRLNLAAETTDATPTVMLMGGWIDAETADLVLTPSTLSAITGSIAARSSDGTVCSMWSIEALVDSGSTVGALFGSAVDLPVTITTGENDTFTYVSNSLNTLPETFTIADGTYTTLADLITALGAAGGSCNVPSNISGFPIPFSSYVIPSDNGSGGILLTIVAGVNGSGGGADNGAVITESSGLGFGTATFSGGDNNSRIVSQAITLVGQDVGAALWALALATSTDGCSLTATGAAGTDIRWVASLEITEVRFNQASVWFHGYDG